MADGDPFTTSNDSVADTNSLTIDGSGSGTGAIEIHEVGGSASADVYREVDTADDGSWATSVLIDNPSSNFHSQKNLFTVSQTENVRLRVENTSGGSAAYYVTGFEVTDS